MSATETMTFEEARSALEREARRVNAGLVSMDEWCDSVHDVLARYQAGVDARTVNLAGGAATAPPREPDPAQPATPELGVMLADADRVNRHAMQDHAA